MIFISYYTKNTPYEEVMNTHLLPSLKKWKLDYDIKAVEDMGDWQKNTSYKPTFILEMLEKHKRDVIFNDADAIIQQYPKLFEDISHKYDLACHYLDWFLHWRNVQGQKKRELLSGTMLFRYNPRVIALLKQYIKDCEKTPNMWEQRILQSLLERRPDMKIYELPASYCAVIRYDNKVPSYIQCPVIVHYQKSRELKRRRKDHE